MLYTIRIIVLSLASIIVLWFLGTFVYGWVAAGRVDRKKIALNIYLQFSLDAQVMLADILKLYRDNKISEINEIVEDASITTNELITALDPEKRPPEFSSGKFGDSLNWTAYMTEFRNTGYSGNAAQILTGIFQFELDTVLENKLSRGVSK